MEWTNVGTKAVKMFVSVKTIFPLRIITDHHWGAVRGSFVFVWGFFFVIWAEWWAGQAFSKRTWDCEGKTNVTNCTGSLGHSKFDEAVLIGSFQRPNTNYIYIWKQTASLSQKESSLRRLLEFNAQFGIIFLIIYGTNQRFQCLSKVNQERCDIFRSSIFSKSWSSGSAMRLTCGYYASMCCTRWQFLWLQQQARKIWPLVSRSLQFNRESRCSANHYK